MAQIGMIDLIGPMQVGAQIAQAARAAQLQREQIRLNALRMVQEMQEARALQAIRERQIAVQEAESNRLAEKWTQEQAQQKQFGELVGTYMRQAQLENMPDAYSAMAGVAPEFTDMDALRQAVPLAAFKSGYAMPQAAQLMGQMSLEDRASQQLTVREQSQRLREQQFEWKQLLDATNTALKQASASQKQSDSEKGRTLQALSAGRAGTIAAIKNYPALIEAAKEELEAAKASVIPTKAWLRSFLPGAKPAVPDAAALKTVAELESQIAEMERVLRDAPKKLSEIDKVLEGFTQSGGVQPATAETVQPSAGFEIEGYQVVPKP